MNERSFESLLYGITANTLARIIESTGWSEDVAIKRFYSSKLYSYLEDEKTKVWQYSSMTLADIFNDECSGFFSLPEV